ncbi:MAG: GTPase Era [Spirochaetales bacterium]|nr:GTPase Era [Spirochaetales bacterium]MDD6841552.1 GTPase Era [Spirochaetales bacterium]
MKSATVSVIGRPSSGKSTLVNTICEMKVSITSPTPQTTRNKIRGIYTDQRGQLVFTDTPGYHLSDKEINKRMQDVTVSALKDSDMILYVIDGKRKGGKEEEAISLMIKKAKVPTVVAINKTDILSKEEMDESKNFVSSRLPSVPILFISAKNDEGVDEVLIELFKNAKEGELLYDENQYTDQDLEFRISEIIREKTISTLSDELPHVIFVDVSDLEWNEETRTVWIRAFINVERDGQKGFIVGKGGSGIKRIGTEARKEIKTIFPGSTVRLDLQVKTAEKWRQNSIVLDKVFRNDKKR